MPRIETAITSIMEKAGLVPKDEAPLMEKLQGSRLGTKELLDGLSEIISNGDNDNVRLRAIETGMKLNAETRHAMNDDAGKPMPVFNIIIKDTQSVAINPILITRKAPVVING